VHEWIGAAKFRMQIVSQNSPRGVWEAEKQQNAR